MIVSLIRWSVRNPVPVLLFTAILTALGVWSVVEIPIDAIPDLSDVQVIVKTSYPGQAPQIVEDQVTFPLTTALLAVPGAVGVRGFSMFGDSYVYVLFEDGTDLYWARSRVLEYLSQAGPRLPAAARSELGPDATGVGWVYQYALTDRTGRHDLADLTSIQDWHLKYELQSIPGVAEVATVGGMVRQYQVVLDPKRLRTYGIPVARVREAIERANQEAGGSVIERAEAESMIRATGYLRGVEDLRRVPVALGSRGTPILLGDVAEVRTGPEMRRGIAELDGEGEVVGGIVVMRWGANAQDVIELVRVRLDEIRRGGLPPGVEIVPTYDRSELIRRAVRTLTTALNETAILVCLMTALFLFHLRSSLVVVLSLPVGVLAAFVVMRFQGINANIMSLGGIAIAVGTMVDAGVVMVENAHKALERDPDSGEGRVERISRAAVEVGPPLFYSLLVVSLAFLPMFALEAQAGRLFAPLVFTKTYSIAAAAVLSVTLVPVLMVAFIRGRIRREDANPLNRAMMAAYRPFIRAVLLRPRTVAALGLLAALSGVWPAFRLGSEFMPPLDEGDLLYMPSTFPGIAAGKGQQLLQQTDAAIRQVREVERVFGKMGRAETATDPAPFEMIETTIRLKPREEWRPGLTLDDLVRELDARVSFPGLFNAWLMPIEARTTMLSTGVRTPVAARVSGPDLAVVEEIGRRVEDAVREVPGTGSVFSERVTGGRYLQIDVDRVRAGRIGLNVADVQEVVLLAVGGMNVSETVEGRERYPINVRYPQEYRDSVARLRDLPIVTPDGKQVRLGEVASVRTADGPPMIRSEDARPVGFVYIDIEGRDLGAYVRAAREAVAAKVSIPAGYSIAWTGQYEHMLRAWKRLLLVIPLTLVLILVLLYLGSRSLVEVVVVLGTLPLALVGSFWTLYLLDYKLSVAVGCGLIAMAGLAVEFGIVMLVYLDGALGRKRAARAADGVPLGREDVREAVVEGALLRLRPKMMTVLADIVGLIPIMLIAGSGSDVMRRIAAPMFGGLLTSTVLTLVVLPAIYLLWKSRGLSEVSRTPPS
jgi:Cu(I)/Ag(I) efflux system membrane protein CusA/SilA